MCALLRWAVVVLGCAMLCSDLRAGTLEERFRAEAPAAWERLKEATWNRSGTLTIIAEAISGFDRNSGGRFDERFDLRGPDLAMLHYKLTLDGHDAPRSHHIYGINPDYCFRADRDEAAGRWKPGTVDRPDPSIAGSGPSRIRSKIDAFAEQLFVAYTIEEESLARMVTARTLGGQYAFRVESIRPVAGEDGESVEVRFTNSVHPRKHFQIRGGRLRLDPARSWCLLDYDLDLFLDRASNSSGRAEYAEVAGFPAPIKFTYDFKATTPAGVLYHRRKTSTIEYSQGSSDASIFRLSHYGLEEPMKRAAVGSSQWPLPVLGVACLCVAAFLRKAGHASSLS